ncbi:sigma-70 family RNA polymerase sigma factor [Paludibacter sp. 221]|uniref:RNA polymerase sigma factor n=1 Tax=Paludibacter sp. 221 TaxID=2302939 RepID=UPI0013D1E2DA|nr:sigma-70 family RNA polymerase sigma factor [Paludibacter sp. 221]NDV45571.1 sigma-70 family RNA polymerase sigma factor [Paludibacter sp. 221]
MSKADIEKKFIETIKENERVIYKVCLFYASDEFPLNDLYQEVVLNLWAAFPKFKNQSSFSTWIYRIALNTCISGMRREMRRPKGSGFSSELQNSLIEPEDMGEEIKEMYHLIHNLKTMERAVILLYLEEKSYQEIADITGLTVSNVATKLKRSKDKLRNSLN